MNFIDTIVVRRTIEKGTKVIKEPVKSLNWAGKEFKKYEKERLKLAGDLMLLSSKGTKKFRLSGMQETTVPDLKGYYITTGRGTGKIML